MTQNIINTKNPIVQYVVNTFTNTVQINTGIPKDNTIPQQTEGVEIATVSITPTNANNLLVINANVWVYDTGAADFVLALFQDSTANALAAMQANFNAIPGALNLGILSFAMTAGTTSSTTFKIRGGQNTGNFSYVNNTEFGGVQTSYIEVMEIKA